MNQSDSPEQDDPSSLQPVLQSPDPIPPWKQELRRHVIECAMKAAVDLGKLAIPQEKQIEIAKDFAEETIKKKSEIIENKLKKTAKSDQDFIRKTLKSIAITPMNLVDFSTIQTGIQDSTARRAGSVKKVKTKKITENDSKSDNPPE
jgi:hypothetical protein